MEALLSQIPSNRLHEEGVRFGGQGGNGFKDTKIQLESGKTSNRAAEIKSTL